MNKLLLFLLLITSSSLIAQLPESTTKTLLLQKASLLGIDSEEIAEVIITDNYTSRGISHVYFKQAVDEIEIHESSFAVHGRSGNYQLVPGSMVRGLGNINVDNTKSLDAIGAITAICSQKNYATPANIQLIASEATAANQQQEMRIANISNSDVPAKLVYYLAAKNKLNLAWSIEIDDVKSADYIHFIVDAKQGNILQEYNYTVECTFDEEHSCGKKNHNHNSASIAELGKKTSASAANSYNVFPWPIEAPHNGARVDVLEPWLDNTTASPNGWHTIGSNNYTTTRGNNVDAYIDDNDSNGPTGGDAARAQGGATLDFDFPLDTNGNPDDYEDAAVTNLFYWNNVVHDVWYNYGFDEPSGNFQEENLAGAGGNDSDYVRAEAQDGGGSCNANFSTPTDGGNPRMQMYLCGGRDGDFDNGVIVHEYGHGISIRLTGGPGTSSCLSGQEQMGEGWSDYFGMVMTIESGDAGTDSRGMGTWLFGQGPNGNGIRPYPYSTDFAVNPFTYDGIKGSVSVPHGVGSVWATVLWEVTWALIDEYGWDADIYNGTGGNNIAMELVIEGLKLQPCGPGFVDGRDAILLADEMLNNGANQCLLWNAFATRGLGYSASQGSSSSRFDGSEAFDLPPSCTIGLTKTVSTTSALPGDAIIYALKAINNSDENYTDLMLSDPIPDQTEFVSATNGGTFDPATGLVTWPTISLPIGDSIEYSMTVKIDQYADGYVPDVLDDVENGADYWSTNNSGGSQWNISNSDAASGTFSWFAADVSSNSVANLILTAPVGASSSTLLTFNHSYDTEVTWDGGVVEISTDGGETWIDQEANFTNNGYNSTINNSRPAFSGDSGGFINSTIDLSAYDGLNFLLRFQMNCDTYVGGNGWWIDDIFLTDLAYQIPNTANISNAEIDINGYLLTPTFIPGDSSELHISTSVTDLSCFESMDGTATVSSSSGTGTYLINWDNGSHAATISNLTAGSYSVTVQDGVTTRTATVLVAQPDSLEVGLVGTAADGGANGSIETYISGGTPDYTYAWNTGGNGSKLLDINAGTYILTLTDDNGCQKVDSISILDLGDCLDNLVQIKLQLDQFASEVTVFVSDGDGDLIFEKNYTPGLNGLLITDYFCGADDCYEIEIEDSGSNGLCNGSSNPLGYYEIIDVASGEVIYTGCDIADGVTHDICYPLMTASFVSADPSCTGSADGTISISASGGSGSYTYDYGTGDTGASASALSPGVYAVMVSDGITSISQDITIYNSVATVYNNEDSGSGSLRFATNNSCVSDTIVFETTLMGDTIYLSTPIVINTVKAINGLGKSNLLLSGGNHHRLFDVAASAQLSLMSMSLIDVDGSAPGGAVFNQGTLYLDEVVLRNVKENGVKKAISGSGDVIIRNVVEVE